MRSGRSPSKNRNREMGSKTSRAKTKRDKINRVRTLNHDKIRKIDLEIKKNPLNDPIKNALRSKGLEKLEQNQDSVLEEYDPGIFSYTIEKDPDPMDQESAGICWICSGLSMMRRQMIKEYNMKTNFNFSFGYLLFWHKLEKCNEMLENIIQLRDTSIKDDHFHSELSCSDGGFYHTFRDLVKKYGVVPNSVFRNRYSVSNPKPLNKMLKYKIREFAAKIKRLNYGCEIDLIEHERRMKDDPDYARSCKKEKPLPLVECYKLKSEFMKDIIKIVIMMVGDPIYPTDTFDWVYQTKSGDKKTVKNITPVEFYEKYCDFNYDEYITIANDPRPRYPYYTKYSRSRYGQERLIRQIGSDNTDHNDEAETYINLPMDEIRELIIRQLDDGIPVYFSADVGKYVDNKTNVMSMKTRTYGLPFNIPIIKTMSKADRIDFCNSYGDHAMTIVGYDEEQVVSERIESEDECGPRPSKRAKYSDDDRSKSRFESIVKFKVENSWGEVGNHKGFYVMDYGWLCEFGMEFNIHSYYLTDEQYEITQMESVTVDDSVKMQYDELINEGVYKISTKHNRKRKRED